MLERAWGFESLRPHFYPRQRNANRRNATRYNGRRGGRTQSIPVRQPGARRRLHRPRSGDRRDRGGRAQRPGRGPVRAASIRQVVARLAGGAAAGAQEGAGRPGGPDDHPDEGAAGGEAGQDDLRGRRVAAVSGQGAPARVPAAAHPADRDGGPGRRLAELRVRGRPGAAGPRRHARAAAAPARRARRRAQPAGGARSWTSSRR